MNKKVNDLHALLKKKNTQLFGILLTIKNNAESILVYVPQTFKEFTPHNIDHSNRIIKILNWFIPEDVQKNLSASELFILLASCYLHDIGMAVRREEIIAVKRDPKFIRFHAVKKHLNPKKLVDDSLVDWLRKIHHTRSEDYINSNYVKLGFRIEDEEIARRCGLICRSHGLEVNEILRNRSDFEPDDSIGDDKINMSYLAACLRVGDILDISYERVPLILMDFVDPKNPKSIKAWKKHRSIIAANPSQEHSDAIKINARCEDPDIYRAVRFTIDDVKSELQNAKAIADANPIFSDRYNFKRLSVDDSKVEAVGFIGGIFKFEFEQGLVTKIIASERLYGRKEVFLRELLQNSLDAVRYRAEGESGSYQPRIEFTYDHKTKIVRCRDNGIGMTIKMIENYLLKIGSTFYESEEFLSDAVNFSWKAISEFGIGLLACYMVSDEIIIETCHENSGPIRIILDDRFAYFKVENINQKWDDYGTNIYLKLKESYLEELKIKFAEWKRIIKDPPPYRSTLSNLPFAEEHNRNNTKRFTVKSLFRDYLEDIAPNIPNIEIIYNEKFVSQKRYIDWARTEGKKRGYNMLEYFSELYGNDLNVQIYIPYKEKQFGFFDMDKVKPLEDHSIADIKSPNLHVKTIPYFISGFHNRCALTQEGIRVCLLEDAISTNIKSNLGLIEISGERRVPLLADRTGFAEKDLLNDNLSSIFNNLFDYLYTKWEEYCMNVDYVSEYLYTHGLVKSLLKSYFSDECSDYIGLLYRLLLIKNKKINRVSLKNINDNYDKVKIVLKPITDSLFESNIIHSDSLNNMFVYPIMDNHYSFAGLVWLFRRFPSVEIMWNNDLESGIIYMNKKNQVGTTNIITERTEGKYSEYNPLLLARIHPSNSFLMKMLPICKQRINAVNVEHPFMQFLIKENYFPKQMWDSDVNNFDIRYRYDFWKGVEDIFKVLSKHDIRQVLGWQEDVLSRGVFKEKIALKNAKDLKFSKADLFI